MRAAGKGLFCMEFCDDAYDHDIPESFLKLPTCTWAAYVAYTARPHSPDYTLFVDVAITPALSRRYIFLFDDMLNRTRRPRFLSRFQGSTPSMRHVGVGRSADNQPREESFH
jgi:hypothetical protein